MWLYPRCSIIRKSKVGKSSKIFPLSVVSNCLIDDFTYIGYCCKINNASIGRYCSIARGVKIGLGKHPTDFISSSPLFYSMRNPLRIRFSNSQKYCEFEKVNIGHDVWIGANVIILDGVSIGDGAIVGANSVVSKDVDPYTIVGGVPAKFIKKRFVESLIERISLLEWWRYSPDEIKNMGLTDLFSKPLDGESLCEVKRVLNEHL